MQNNITTQNKQNTGTVHLYTVSKFGKVQRSCPHPDSTGHPGTDADPRCHGDVSKVVTYDLFHFRIERDDTGLIPRVFERECDRGDFKSEIETM